MIATWMLYCCLCALGISAAAALAERVLLAGRTPVRGVWVVAVILSLLVPVAAFRFAPRPVVAAPAANVVPEIAPASPVGTVAAAQPSVAQPAHVPRDWNWRAALGRLDGSLTDTWVGLSLALTLYFFGGVVALAWMRRRWQRRDLLGVPVFVSERTGPALVGVLSPMIVVPEWALSMEPNQLALMLRHEQEHQRARDGQLLTAVQLALIAMPWNVALWWQLLRLRVAVELDCDARVLRYVDARSYGDLLLEVARPRRTFGLIGATAFAERATQLERRIRVLARRRSRASRASRAAAVCIGLAAVSVAWVAPRPPVPARTIDLHLAPTVVALSKKTISRAIPPVTTEQPKPAPTPKPALDGAKKVELVRPVPVAAARDSAAAMPNAVVVTMTSMPCNANDRGDGAIVDSIFRLIFAGIALTNDQQSRACGMLARLHREQMTADSMAAVTLLFDRVRRDMLQHQRNVSLRELLTNDADRTTFDAHVAQEAAPNSGGRGRSGGLPPDLAAGGRRGGGGGGGRGVQFDSLLVTSRSGARGGGRGGSPADLVATVADLMASLDAPMSDATFHRLFDGIALTPDQEKSARTLIMKTQQEMRMPLMPPPARIRVNQRTGLVFVPSESATALLDLVSNLADRATIQSRIMVIPPR